MSVTHFHRCHTSLMGVLRALGTYPSWRVPGLPWHSFFYLSIYLSVSLFLTLVYHVQCCSLQISLFLPRGESFSRQPEFCAGFERYAFTCLCEIVLVHHHPVLVTCHLCVIRLSYVLMRYITLGGFPCNRPT